MKTKQIDFSNGKVFENIMLAAGPMLVAQVLNAVIREIMGKHRPIPPRARTPSPGIFPI